MSQIENQSSVVGSGLDRDALIPLIRLALVPGIGPRTLCALLEKFGDPRSCLAASTESLCSVPNVGPKLAHAITNADLHVDAPALIDWCDQNSVRIITRAANDYPAPLTQLPDAPPLLFARGGWMPHDALAIAVVGSRHPTAYGRRQTERIVGGLARRGFTIVSGLARGIDSCAHRAALDAGGRTVAVLGSGVIDVYPPEHQSLAAEIAQQGAVLSECPPWSQPKRGMFPQRNRLISALGLAVVVMEAGDRSGALITARHAGEQGRDVMALPGAVSNRMSRGCHALIRDGARLIESAEQIVEELGPLAEGVPADQTGPEIRHPGEVRLNEQERAVLDQIATEATSIEAVATASGLAIHRVLSTLSVLQRRGLVRQLGGQKIVRI